MDHILEKLHNLSWMTEIKWQCLIRVNLGWYSSLFTQIELLLTNFISYPSNIFAKFCHQIHGLSWCMDLIHSKNRNIQILVLIQGLGATYCILLAMKDID